MIKAFRAIAFVEGLSAIALFLVAMPAKYVFGNPALVPPVGYAHGMFWVAYMLAMLVVFSWKRAPLLDWVRATLASFVPFGTFWNDRNLERLQSQSREAYSG